MQHPDVMCLVLFFPRSCTPINSKSTTRLQGSSTIHGPSMKINGYILAADMHTHRCGNSVVSSKSATCIMPKLEHVVCVSCWPQLELEQGLEPHRWYPVAGWQLVGYLVAGWQMVGYLVAGWQLVGLPPCRSSPPKLL